MIQPQVGPILSQLITYILKIGLHTVLGKSGNFFQLNCRPFSFVIGPKSLTGFFQILKLLYSKCYLVMCLEVWIISYIGQYCGKMQKSCLSQEYLRESRPTPFISAHTKNTKILVVCHFHFISIVIPVIKLPH